MGVPLFASTMPVKDAGQVPLLYSAPPKDDPFAAFPPNEQQQSPINSSSFIRSLEQGFSSAKDGGRLQSLKADFEAARLAVAEGRGEEALAHYTRALDSLASPLGPGPVATAPLFKQIERGGDLYREALFGASALAGQQDSVGLLKRLDEFLKSPTEFGSPATTDLLQARLLKAFVIMQFNAGSTVQRLERYEEAERIAQSVVDNTSLSEIAPDLLLPANALLLEIVARRYERAARQGDVKKRRELLPRFTERATILLANQADAPLKNREIAAAYEADVIGFLAKMQLWNVAVDRARSFTTNKVYASTAGAADVLANPLLQPFVDEGRVLSAKEIKQRAPAFKAAFAKVRAAFANAGAANLAESATVGALSAGAWMLADKLADGQVDSALVPAIVAAGVSVFNKLRNGFMSDEAKSAGMTGVYNRSVEESAKDVAKLLFQGGLETGAWLAPTSLVAVAPEAGALALQTLGSAADLYARFFRWSGASVASLFSAETYAGLPNAISSLSPNDVGSLAYKLYLGGTAAQYISFLLFPKMRPALAKSAKYFIPGAVMLGAELGMAITGTDDYMNRIERSSLAVAEGLSMLLASGVVALAKSRNKNPLVSVVSPLWHGIKKMDHNALVAIALTVGVSSAMGGMMQRGARPEDIALLAVQGAATTVGLLGVVLGISGIMKREIELIDGIQEGWADSKGEIFPARVWQSLLSGADSFWTPYVFNRVGRAPTLDVPTAGLRSMIGWDTNLGYVLFALLNSIATNPTATAVYPETGAKEWERDALKQMLRRNEADRVADHFLKAGQRLPLSHVLRPHNLSDSLFPLYAIKRVFKQPLFPMMPQPHYFGSLQQLIDGGYWNSLDAEELESMLGVLESITQAAFVSGGTVDEQAKRLVQQDFLRSIFQVLVLTREGEQHGKRIQRFLKEHQWVSDLLSIDEKMPSKPEGRYRRQRRKFVNGQVEMSMERYDEHVREHAVRNKPSALDDAFKDKGKKRIGGILHSEPSGEDSKKKGSEVAAQAKVLLPDGKSESGVGSVSAAGVQAVTPVKPVSSGTAVIH